METVKRRNRVGTAVDNWHSWKTTELADIQGTFAAEEYLDELLFQDPGNINKILSVPEGVDKSLWQYELLRGFIKELNSLIVLLGDVCNKETCPQMKATDEWVYLCAGHSKAPQECCAIDYSVHTIDGATALLNSNKFFPSRVTIKKRKDQFMNIARRLYRVFAHAFFHHRDVYNTFEKDTHVCERFVRFCQVFKLVPPEQLIIPENEVAVR
eukprot:GCRY01003533.1.p1 GENE.GCRY01003533.1~~GCRY01003533.1.p1  ORF type:complete len:212 (+),score=15.93 GCRY01003533.1:109-744(+)